MTADSTRLDLPELSDGELPATTTWVLVLVGLLPTMGIVAFEPVLGIGVLAGLVLAIGVVGFEDSIVRPALATALLPIGFVLSVAGITLASRITPGTSFVLVGAIALGIGLVATVAGGLSRRDLEWVGIAMVIGGIVAVAAASFIWMAAAAGGPLRMLAAIGFAPGDGALGLTIGIAVAGGALSIGARSLPRAVYAPAHGDTVVGASRTRRTVVSALLTITVVLIVLLQAIVILAIGSTDSAELGGVASTPLLRVLLAFQTVTGVALVGISGIYRWGWSHSSEPQSPIGAFVVGAIVGVGVSWALATGGGIAAPYSASMAGLLGLIAIVLAVVGLAVRWVAGRIETVSVAGGTLLAGGLIATGVLREVVQPAIPAVSVNGLVTMSTLAAGLFVYIGARQGRTLSAEVGPSSVTPDNQLVYLGFYGVVTLAGIVFAMAMLWVAAVLAPALLVPAALGVLFGLAAFTAGIWLLYT